MLERCLRKLFPFSRFKCQKAAAVLAKYYFIIVLSSRWNVIADEQQKECSAAKNNKKILKEVSNKTIIQKIQKLQNLCVRDCVFYALIVSRRHRLTEQRPSREKLLVTFTPRPHFHNKQTSPIWPILCWRGRKTLLNQPINQSQQTKKECKSFFVCCDWLIDVSKK